jgi:hypothetical protein
MLGMFKNKLNEQQTQDTRNNDEKESINKERTARELTDEISRLQHE